MPERGGLGGERRSRSPSAKQPVGLSGSCSGESSSGLRQGMAGSHRSSGNVRGTGMRCPAQPDHAGACRVLDSSERTDKIERQWIV
jgi:hypothetical protein